MQPELVILSPHPCRIEIDSTHKICLLTFDLTGVQRGRRGQPTFRDPYDYRVGVLVCANMLLHLSAFPAALFVNVQSL